MASKLKEIRKSISYWPRTLRLIWQAAPKWTSTWMSLLVVQGFLPAVSIYLTELLVDNLILAINAKGRVGNGSESPWRESMCDVRRLLFSMSRQVSWIPGLKPNGLVTSVRLLKIVRLLLLLIVLVLPCVRM